MENLYGRVYADKQLRRTPDSIMAKVAEMPILPGERVLELGVTNSNVSRHVRRAGGLYVGVDINPAVVERLKRETGEELVVADARHLPFADESFDKIISIHTLEHIRYLSEALAELYRITKPGGQNIHIFPADYLFKEESAIADALRIHPLNPIKAVKLASELHQYKLDMEEIRRNMVSAPFGAYALGEFRTRTFPIPRRDHYLRIYKSNYSNIR